MQTACDPTGHRCSMLKGLVVEVRRGEDGKIIIFHGKVYTNENYYYHLMK